MEPLEIITLAGGAIGLAGSAWTVLMYVPSKLLEGWKIFNEYKKGEEQRQEALQSQINDRFEANEKAIGKLHSEMNKQRSVIRLYQQGQNSSMREMASKFTNELHDTRIKTEGAIEKFSSQLLDLRSTIGAIQHQVESYTSLHSDLKTSIALLNQSVEALHYRMDKRCGIEELKSRDNRS